MASFADITKPVRQRFRVPRVFRRAPRDPRLPKPGTPEWKREARRQARHLANSPGEAEDIAFVDSLYEPWDD